MSFGLPCWACREQDGKSKKPNVVLQVSLAGSLSSPRERVCDFFRLALLGLQGASLQKQNAELGVARLGQVCAVHASCPLLSRCPCQ